MCATRNRIARVTCVTLGLMSVRTEWAKMWKSFGETSGPERSNLKAGLVPFLQWCVWFLWRVENLVMLLFPLDKSVHLFSHHHLHSCLICTVWLWWSWERFLHTRNTRLLTLTPSFKCGHAFVMAVMGTCTYTDLCTFALQQLHKT